MTKEVMDVLVPVVGEELARDIIAHRKGLKCPLTPRGAQGLIKQYQLAGNPVAAAEYQLNMGWRGFDVSWLKGKGFTDPHNPMPSETPEERNRRHRLKDEMRWAESEGDHVKAAQLRSLLTQNVRAH